MQSHMNLYLYLIKKGPVTDAFKVIISELL